jgi:hypothetical protein
MIDRELETYGGLFMIYLLEFLGFLAVAILFAASPLLGRAVEYILPRRVKFSGEAKGHEPFQARSDQARSAERSEIRDEIRRMTAILEVDRRGIQRDPHS